jgi:hypothetical protein
MGTGGKAVGITVEANAISRIRSHALGAPLAAIRVMNQITIRARDRVGEAEANSENILIAGGAGLVAGAMALTAGVGTLFGVAA